MSSSFLQIILAARNNKGDAEGWMQMLVFIVLAIFWAIGGIVKARANQRAQQKIENFKSSIRGHFQQLGISLYTSDNGIQGGIDAIKIYGFLSGFDGYPGWPRVIWDNEEELVRKELLATMDEFQKALLAAEKAEPGENRPEGAQDAESAEND